MEYVPPNIQLTNPGPVRLRNTSRTALQPAAGCRVTGGFWGERRRVNQEVSLRAGWEQLHNAGNFLNLELAAGQHEGTPYVTDLPFLDSDLYKWLEALAWASTDPSIYADINARLEDCIDSTVRLLETAHASDGYLNSYFQVNFPGQRFKDLAKGHELYCAGHLIQAGLALRRARADDRLLHVARRMAELIERSFGGKKDQIDGYDGHPGIEMALIELYREGGREKYSTKARWFIDRRGHGLLPAPDVGSQYWQDRVHVRKAKAVEGHCVRQLYFLAGCADSYIEDGDESLRKALVRLWEEMVSTKTYLTGGIGTHHSDESFGDPYELTNERSYCETCAAIASIFFSFRMLLITGHARYADLIERTLFNAFLAGPSLDGKSWIYCSPLQVREGHLSASNNDYSRREWFKCACCPPNTMRLLASLEHYIVLAEPQGIRLHQFVSGTFTVPVDNDHATISVETNYPWDGRVHIRVERAPKTTWSLTTRRPSWAESMSMVLNGERIEAGGDNHWDTVTRAWDAGDMLIIDLPVDPRFTRADPRVDAARGSVALEYGPLVYCFEAIDHKGHRLDDLIIDPAKPVGYITTDSALPASLVSLVAEGWVRKRPSESWWPYTHASTALPDKGKSVMLTAVPYYAWGNRGKGASMRIWMPTE